MADRMEAALREADDALAEARKESVSIVWVQIDRARRSIHDALLSGGSREDDA